VSAAPPLIGNQLDAIRELCRRYHVTRLELFGSATRDDFDPNRSDLDFLVEFAPLSPSDRADAYFGLLEALQDLFRREIDLVESPAITNPYFKQAVDAERTVLYAA
jgi:uncharacterized protein